MGNVEKSKSKEFMFWKRKHGVKYHDVSPPTDFIPMSWRAFVDKANALDASPLPDEPHYYWHTNGKKHRWITDELDLFSRDNDFFIVDPEEYTVPIACRVGTKGLCNENHYDTHRTFAAQLVGSKRWIFMPPSECSKLYLFPDNHLSARHS
jgi:hypothetical protein